MTDPVQGISGARETTSGGTAYSGGRHSEDRRKRSANTQEGDLVEISQAARVRVTGKKRKSILEYLKELFG